MPRVAQLHNISSREDVVPIKSGLCHTFWGEEATRRRGGAALTFTSLLSLPSKMHNSSLSELSSSGSEVKSQVVGSLSPPPSSTRHQETV